MFLYGIDAYRVEIEVNCGRGEMGVVVIVGLPDAAVKESKDRVWTAIVNSGFKTPKGRTTINLAPANIKKEGPSFDLPIALGVLAANGDISEARLPDVCVVGELALSGEVRRVRGMLPIALAAKEKGLRGIIVPEENAEEAAVVEGLEVFPVRNLRQAADFIDGERTIPRKIVDKEKLFDVNRLYEENFADVKGQEYAKRALEVAVSGGHNIIFIGPPGTGKTMLAKRVPSILPPLSLDEALETTKIHSIAGTLSAHQAIVSRRPFRAPHHTISDAGLLGGGSHPSPGEVSIAHNGVLFLDELPEFRRNVLEVLRQPLEDGSVSISRAAVSVTFPCQFMLVAAMNPCPCGYYGDSQRECRCAPAQIQRYRNKISGPLLDRIDLHVEVPSIHFDELSSLEPGEPSSAVRERVIVARQIQHERFKENQRVHCNATMNSRDLQTFCELDAEAHTFLKMAITELNFSARAYDRILKVARTIADLAGTEQIQSDHVSEAIQYRTLDKQIW